MAVSARKMQNGGQVPADASHNATDAIRIVIWRHLAP